MTHALWKMPYMILLGVLMSPLVAAAAPTSPPAPTCALDATPRAITEGVPMRLEWRTTNASEASIAPIGPVPLQGSMVREPSFGKAEYVLTAKGLGGVAVCSVSVIVRTAVVEIPSPGWLAWFIAPVTNAVWYVAHPLEWFEVEEYVEYEDDRGLVIDEIIDIEDETPWWRRIEERLFPDYYEEVEYDRGEVPESMDGSGDRWWDREGVNEFLEEELEGDVPGEGESGFRRPPEDAHEFIDIEDDPDGEEDEATSAGTDQIDRGGYRREEMNGTEEIFEIYE